MIVLFLGCHCDDIELGCGATLHKYKEDWYSVCVTLSSYGPLDQDHLVKRQSRESLSQLGARETIYYNFSDLNFSLYRQRIWEVIKELDKKYKPQIVFSHQADDHHDHCVVYKETLNNFKNRTVLCYKPSFRNGIKHEWNWIEKISNEDLEAKITALGLYHQFKDKNYFSPENIRAQAKIYAMPLDTDGLAEGFFAERIVN